MKPRKVTCLSAIAALLLTASPVQPVVAQQTGPNYPTGNYPQMPDDDDVRDNGGGIGTGGIIAIGVGLLGLAAAAKMLMKNDKVKPFTKNTVVMLYQGRPSEAEIFAGDEGLREIDSEYLDSIDMTMIAARSGRKEKPDETVARLAGSPRVAVVQREGVFQEMGSIAALGPATASTTAPIAMTAMAAAGGGGVKIAMIDSLVDLSHENLKSGWIKQQNFTGSDIRSAHGTAIASLIAGSGQVRGKAAGQNLFSFAAFSGGRKNKPGTARTRNLARAINAAARQNPHIVNMSFGGPNDAVLTRLLNRVASRGTCLVAATGNGGKKASPPFPARLDKVIGITAVDKKMRAYKFATPGFHVGAAASGVSRLTAVPGGYRIASGTSFASADVAGQLSRSSVCSGRRGSGLKSHISRRARDLGRPGRDDVYGYGLFQL